jgi:hypothetical protein
LSYHLPRCTRSAVWCHTVESLSISTVLTLYFGRTVAACLHVLQAWSALLACMSCRLMMALTSPVLETCVCTLRTHRPSRMGRPAMPFFMFVAHGPQGTMGRVAAWSPPSREAGSGALHTGPEPRDMWQRRSPPRLGGRIQCC